MLLTIERLNRPKSITIHQEKNQSGVKLDMKQLQTGNDESSPTKSIKERLQEILKTLDTLPAVDSLASQIDRETQKEIEAQKLASLTPKPVDHSTDLSMRMLVQHKDHSGWEQDLVKEIELITEEEIEDEESIDNI